MSACEYCEPCPFCGSEHVYGSKVRNGIYRVECWCCGASVESVTCIDKAIKWWNTRAIDRDELLRIASELEAAEGWCDQNGYYATGLVSISESKLREWSDRIRKLAKKEDEHGTD